MKFCRAHCIPIASLFWEWLGVPGVPLAFTREARLPLDPVATLDRRQNAGPRRQETQPEVVPLTIASRHERLVARLDRLGTFLESLQEGAVVVIILHDHFNLRQPAWPAGVDMWEAAEQCVVVWDPCHLMWRGTEHGSDWIRLNWYGDRDRDRDRDGMGYDGMGWDGMA